MKSFLCPSCGRSLEITRRKIKCLCGMVMALPRPSMDPPGELIRFPCQTCGKKLKAKEDWAGRGAKCPRCGSPALIPAPQAAVETAVPDRSPRTPTPAIRPPPDDSFLLLSLPSLPPESAAPDRNAVRPPTRQPLFDPPMWDFSSPAGVVSVAAASLALALLFFPVPRGLTVAVAALAGLVGFVGLASGLRTGGAVGLAAGGSLASVLCLAAVGLMAVFTGDGDSARPVDPTLPGTSLSLTLDRKDDVQVVVAAATVGPAPSLGADRGQWAGKPLLMTCLRVENLGPRPVTFRGWDNSPPNRPEARPRLADNRGRSYAQLEFRLPGAAPVGQPRQPQPVTARGIADVLFFEPPDSGVEWLTLNVPASAVGQSGVFVLRVHGSAIRRSDQQR